MISQKELKDSLTYDPETGVFKWAIRKHGVTMGSVAGSTDTTGYIGIKIGYSRHKAHRLAWLYVHGEWPSGEVDHKNHNRADNRIQNLRDVSRQDNSKNKSAYSNNKLGVMGVAKTGNNYSARIKTEGKSKNLGVYKSIEGAVAARKKAEKELGFYENHGD